ncbi:MAG: chorismate synthase [Proteobacteria bacterium]|nr:chorismate synthase [Pseudomonadota bacterium]
MGNTFGRLFRVSTFGESHGKALGVVIDGCPAGLEIASEEIQHQLDRRKPGQSEITTSRSEADRVQILSGVFEGVSLGTSIGLTISNTDAKSSSYTDLKDLYRPGHADYTYDARYGIRDWRGGGRASARETAVRVAAGAVAGIMLRELVGLRTLAWVDRIYTIEADIDPMEVTAENIEKSLVRCPHGPASEKMVEAVKAAKKQGNSLGGRIRFRIDGCPAGLGAPVFDKLTAELAKACMSIPAARSVGFGLGERAAELTGAEHNDPFMVKEGRRIGTETNRAGGMLGGISTGEQIYGAVSFKPTATIRQEQKTVTKNLEETLFQAGGRHDPCVLPRAVPIVEAMLDLVIADQILLYSIATMDRLKKIFN